MSEINERAIVKFLAEQMELRKIRDGYAISIQNASWWSLKITQTFNPWIDMNHAFAVEDAIYKRDTKIISDYLRELISVVGEETDDTETHIWTLYFMTVAFVAHASPRQRTIAAVKALADDEQRKEWGL